MTHHSFQQLGRAVLQTEADAIRAEKKRSLTEKLKKTSNPRKLATILKIPLYRLQMIVEGYYPGFSCKACEIVEQTAHCCPEAKYAVAIVLSAIERQAQTRAWEH